MSKTQVKINSDFTRQLRTTFPSVAWMKDKELIEWSIAMLISSFEAASEAEEDDEEEDEEIEEIDYYDGIESLAEMD